MTKGSDKLRILSIPPLAIANATVDASVLTADNNTCRIDLQVELMHGVTPLVL